MYVIMSVTHELFISHARHMHNARAHALKARPEPAGLARHLSMSKATVY